MKRKLLITGAFVLTIVCIIMLTALTGDQTDTVEYMPGLSSSEMCEIENSPECLAYKSSLIYTEMMQEKMSPEDGFNALYDCAVESSRLQMDEYRNAFISEINATKAYLESNGVIVEGYDFAATQYSEDKGSATIPRIQKQSNGKQYYFVQSFILEDGQWRISGDNLCDPFQIKQKFLFWYI